MARKKSNNFTGLPNEVVITLCTRHDNADELHVTFPEPDPECPGCGYVDCTKKDHIPFRIRHFSHNRRGVAVSLVCTRWRCRNCGKTFTVRTYWIHQNLLITTDLLLAVRLDLAELLSMSAIARNNCVPVSTVKSILDHLSMTKPDRLPETLCIDEFKGDSGNWNPETEKWDPIRFHCSIADGDCGAVIDILPVTTSQYLVAYFTAFPPEVRRRVRFFCCDMHNAYPSLAKRCFPEAVISIDLFHVTRRPNDAVDEVRRRIQNDLLDQEKKTAYESLKHSALILKTAKSSQIERWGDSYGRRKKRLDELLSAYPDLENAYSMLQEFHNIMDTRGYALQRAMTTDWIRGYSSSDVPEVRATVQTVKHWRSYIQNSFKYGKSNVPCEGLNNKIKVIRRISFGVHDFDSFRKRILLSCGYIH